MPATNLRGRLDRSKIAPLKAKRSKGSYRFEKPKFVQRQGLPENNFLPPDPTSSDGDSENEDEDEDEGMDNSSGDEDDSDTPNPFEPTTATGSQYQSSITAPSKTRSHPFPTHSTTSISTTSTSSSAYPPTSTDTIGINTSSGLLSTSSTFPSSFTTSPTEVVPQPDRSTGVATPASTSPVASRETVNASDHPIAKAGIIVPSLLGAVAAVVAAYLLFRYCTPLRARWAVYRARKAQRLPGEEEDGTAPKAAPPMSEAAAGPTLSLARDTAIALPVTARRGPPPTLNRTGSRNNPAHGPDAAQHGRSQSSTPSLHDYPIRPPAYTSGGYGSHAFQLDVEDGDDDAGPRNTDNALFRHPNGLANNPPTPVSRHHPALATPSSQGPEATSRVPDIPCPPASLRVGGLGMDFPLPPSTPSAAHFSTPSPPESTFNSPRRLHKSITPSESISNVPDSPFPFSPALLPPIPVLNSRWSHNSSSVNGRTTASTEEEERRTAPPQQQHRHSAGPGLVGATLSSPRSQVLKMKKSTLSLGSPPS
ncbi:uncharacterized protein Z520_03517 [Fonsecaea multimorphosa CBS 102226]|uniref:Uncharacterized protein n=1 Tax=Fonsecaea multimorphosa CBS 102226 TaxID=1442371 RepID=A0A0D2HG37_9EURO|nr:uncharacterized protein Z520_03517 [Fonsecaea multimorphosa CBS 102226]KIY00851.1 hypothetical protein Z520_03517 [Fonsecaea multimorphosa CBS 102226]OAL27680.1 hypothetical protein AYO22_03346 [Fonsecaea multimorphosa]